MVGITKITSEIHAAKAPRRAGFHFDQDQFPDIHCNLCGSLSENDSRALLELRVGNSEPSEVFSFALPTLTDSLGERSVNGDGLSTVSLAKLPLSFRGAVDCILMWRFGLLVLWLGSSASSAMT